MDTVLSLPLTSLDSEFFVEAFGALFAIMNPFLVLPMFLSLTDGATAGEQRATGLRVVFFAAILCAVIAAAGTTVLDFFGISVNDFRVGGGLVLLLMGLNMLQGERNTAHQGTPVERKFQEELSTISFYPLAFPMAVGPGTITVLILYSFRAGSNMPRVAALVAAVAAVLLILGMVLFFAAAIGHILSQNLRAIITRLMGMILIAIAVSMVAAGLKVLFPALAVATGAS